MNRKPILFALAIAAVFALAGCGGTTSPAIVVTLTNVPSTLTTNQSVTLSAAVANDTAAGNVNWTCAPSGSCGSFSPATTSNGGNTTYTAPMSTGTVTITATDADSSGSFATASISIVAVGTNSELSGTYVYFVEGTNVDGLYAATGTIVADGNGNITSGEQDYFDATGVSDTADTLTGSYSVASSGQGSLTLSLANTLILPNGGDETFSFAVTSATHGLIIEFDGTATSSGELDLQYPVGGSPLTASQVAGAYAFGFSGEDAVEETSLTFGGAVNLSAATGSITGGTIYENDGGSLANANASGTVTGPDSFGRGTITISGVLFNYYAVLGSASSTQCGVLRVVEGDIAATGDITAGAFYSQGAPGAGASFSNSSLKGTYAFFESGSTTLGPLAIAGQFNADGSGDLSAGFADTNDDGTHASGSIAGTGVYSIAGSGSGTLTLPGTPSTTEDVSALLIFATDPNLNLNDPNNTSGGGGAVIMDDDTGAQGTGLIVSQTTGTFGGNYAVNLQYYTSTGEEDFVGQSVASGTGLTGTVDVNDSGVTASAVTFSGSDTADTTNVGRYTGSFTVGGNSYNITYYQISAGALFIVDTDSADVGNGFMETQ